MDSSGCCDRNMDDTFEVEDDKSPLKSKYKIILEDLFSDMPKCSQWIRDHYQLGRWVYCVDVVDIVFRGLGQVVFMNNSITGLFVFIGLLLQSPYIGVCALIGCTCNSISALILKVNTVFIRSGLHGYNGCLVGAALATFVSPEWNWRCILAVIVLSSCVPFFHVAISNYLNPYGLPVLTMPFNIVTLLFLIGTIDYNWWNVSFQPAIIDSQSKNTIGIDWELITSIPRGVGQVYLCDNWISGLLIWIGILICSRLAALFALIGSLSGIGYAYLVGAPYSEITFGLWGYNPVLGAIAIGGFFYQLRWQTAVMAIFTTLATNFVFGALKVLLSIYGVPSLTLGFCIGTYVFLFQKATFDYFPFIPLHLLTTHEGNLKLIPKHRKPPSSNKELIRALMDRIGVLEKKVRGLRKELRTKSSTNIHMEATSLTEIVDAENLIRGGKDRVFSYA